MKIFKNYITKGFSSKAAILFLMLFTVVYGAVFAVLRVPFKDETTYIGEALLMAESLKNFEWFGNLPVGLHGFLFKIPAAVLILAFGSPVLMCTITTIFFAVLSCYFCYRIMQKLLLSDFWAISATWMVITSYYFVLSSATFYREISILFAVLVFIYVIISNKNKWITGLSLLLVLDAKEYAFFAFLPAFFIWVCIEEYNQARQSEGKPGFNYVRRVVSRCFAAVLPGLIYLVLMFSTGIIPLNMFSAFLLGLSERGIKTLSNFFEPGKATMNLVKDAAKTIFQISGLEHFGPWGFYVQKTLNIILQYIGKILYPRSFSFIAIPRFVVLPALIMSVHLFRKREKTNSSPLVLLSLILWIYLTGYILRMSHGRYLIPVLPVIVLFFIFFVRDGIKEYAFAGKTLLFTSLFVAAGLYFENVFIKEKLVLSLFFMGFLWLLPVISRKKIQDYKIASAFFVFLLGCCTFTVSIAASAFLPDGQIRNFFAWGRNMEYEKVVESLPENRKVFVNVQKYWALAFDRDSNYLQPEWKRDLKEWIPKKRLLVRNKGQDVFWRRIGSVNNLHDCVTNNDIEFVCMIVSEHPDYFFPSQEFLEEMLDTKWLKLDKEISLKNKKLFIFKVIHS